MSYSAMRAAAVVFGLLGAVACGKKDKPKESQPIVAASASVSSPPLTYGTAAPSASLAAVGAAKAFPTTSKAGCCA